MAADAKSSPPLLKRRPVRVGLGLALLGLSVLVGVAAQTMPFVEIQAGQQTYPILGAEQSGNLHLVLVATGALGALLALYYAVSRARLRVAFFVVGGIAAVFSAILLLSAVHTVRLGLIRDLTLYEKVHNQTVEMQVGTGLWACLFAAAGILLLAAAVFQAGAPAPEPPAPERRGLARGIRPY